MVQPNGFFNSPTLGVPAGSSTPTIATKSAWSSTGSGVCLYDNLERVDISNIYYPIGLEGNFILDDTTNAANHANLLADEAVTGFIYTVCVEDIAATSYDGESSRTSAIFASTLKGLYLEKLCIEPMTPDINLVQFIGEADKCDAILEWITFSESNIDRFEIERSTNGFNFYTVGEVLAAGTSMEMNRYLYKDVETGHLSYYRLKIVSYDERISYSEVILVEGDCTEEVYIERLFPNPVKTSLNADLQFDSNQIATVIITNVAGHIFMFKEYDFAKGLNSIVFDVNDFPSGFYFLQIMNEEGSTKNEKFIKI